MPEARIKKIYQYWKGLLKVILFNHKSFVYFTFSTFEESGYSSKWKYPNIFWKYKMLVHAGEMNRKGWMKPPRERV